MKCRLTVELEVVEEIAPDALKDQCVRRGSFLFAPAGTLIDDPECWRIVLNGQAVPADEECEQKTSRTPEQIAAAELAAKRLAKGIHPDDFDRFDRGELLGYDANGNDILSQEAAEKAASEDEEDE